MIVSEERLSQRATVIRMARTIVNGRPDNTITTIEDNLPCLLESTAPRSLAMSQGWVERASFVCTWIKQTCIRPGDVLIFEGCRHLIKTVRRDLQGNYYTAILEAELK